jgi:ComF family protein
MKYIYDLWDDFLSLLFPRLCCGCGTHLMRNEKLLCTECYISIPRTDYHLSEDNPVSKLFWGRCNISRASAFSYYTKGSRIRKIIHALKYKGIQEIGTEMGRIYAASLNGTGFLDGIDIIIPVPLHPSRERKRGFNQSDLICEGLSEVSGIPFRRDVMKRVSMSDTQTKRSRYERWLNVDGIFEVADPLSIEGKHLLVVDDVITTGSTIEACASELLKIKDVRVSVIALAVAVM